MLASQQCGEVHRVAVKTSRTEFRVELDDDLVGPPEYAALTPKKRVFVDEYIIDFQLKRAMKAAGYTTRSDGRGGTASEVLRSTRVQRAIRARLRERADRLQLSGDRVVLELMRIACYDIR